MLHISLAAETLFHIGRIPITNAFLTTYIVMALLVVMAVLTRRNLSLVPANGQSVIELLIGGLYDFFSSILGKYARMVFPLIVTLFIYIMTSNYIGLLPGVGTVGFFRKEAPAAEAAVTKPAATTAEVAAPKQEPIAEEAAAEAKKAEQAVVRTDKKAESEAVAVGETEEFVPLFRGPNADLNMTLALAIIAVIGIQYFGFKAHGFHYGKRFINFSNPIMFFIGVLEIISDASKIISFAFRLFGNIFAGEVLLSVMAFLMPFIAPMPFLVLELFVGFIQALVFSTLTAVFINVAVSHE